MNRKKQLINEIADLVLDKLDEESKIGSGIKHAFSYAKSRILNKSFDFASIVQDIERKKYYAEVIKNYVKGKDLVGTYHNAIEFTEILTKAFDRIKFTPNDQVQVFKPDEDVPAQYQPYNDLSSLAHSLIHELGWFIAYSKPGHRYSPEDAEISANRVVSILSKIISILEPLNTYKRSY